MKPTYEPQRIRSTFPARLQKEIDQASARATQAAEAVDELRTALAQAPTALQPARTEARISV